LNLTDAAARTACVRALRRRRAYTLYVHRGSRLRRFVMVGVAPMKTTYRHTADEYADVLNYFCCICNDSCQWVDGKLSNKQRMVTMFLMISRQSGTSEQNRSRPNM